MEEVGLTGSRSNSTHNTTPPLITATLVEQDEKGPASEEIQELRELVLKLETKVLQQDEAIQHFQQALEDISSGTRESRASSLDGAAGEVEDQRRMCWSAITSLICICMRKIDEAEEEILPQYHEPPGHAVANELCVLPVDVGAVVQPQDIILDQEDVDAVCASDNQMRETPSVLPATQLHCKNSSRISTTMPYDDPTGHDKERLKRHT